MITINVDGGEETVKFNNPELVEVYTGAMHSYEHFDLGGVRWKLPTGMVIDLVAAAKAKGIGQSV